MVTANTPRLPSRSAKWPMTIAPSGRETKVDSSPTNVADRLATALCAGKKCGDRKTAKYP